MKSDAKAESASSHHWKAQRARMRRNNAKRLANQQLVEQKQHQSLQKQLQRIPQELWLMVYWNVFTPTKSNYFITDFSKPPAELSVCSEGRKFFASRFFRRSTFIATSRESLTKWINCLRPEHWRLAERQVINHANYNFDRLPQLRSSRSRRNYVTISVLPSKPDGEVKHHLEVRTYKPSNSVWYRLVAECDIRTNKFPRSEVALDPANWLPYVYPWSLEKKLDWSIFLVWWEIARVDLSKAVDLFLQLPADITKRDRHLLTDIV
ncbi:hypothetical protein K431DRAFT_292098 [Polychaeton citri CBS 116435]|uniref:Uncharacterized protein n=1 Tax=Polychaeton citri CBS 116435 TaxID=1314669 RepID=A0A9P4UPT8_9PEZI|nr:hypothetical protein K431DRAFT_292098 [Polychaeton citri CBS 116435]